ncbi:XRE family transcriptional regulator [Streptomyces achromogenes]|uniref:XRE family transcriptional regulator n=1 Tax=Streptomyces achromogenes TaxID=67255 RepID=UPI00371DF375
MGELPPHDDVSPPGARDAAGFIAAMRRLKERSGLTYRELEERAAHRGDVLARSTLADVLRRTSLPRPEVLAAFVRACGDGERVDAWLDARDRLAAAGPAAEPAQAHDPEPAEAHATETGALPRTGTTTVARPRRRPGARTVVGAITLTLAVLALAAWALLPDGSKDPGGPVSSAAPSLTPAGGWGTIRPARTPDLCVTDGRDRAGAYGSAVAVQLPCAQATVPRTYLEPAGEGLYRIQWHHPQHGKGCLTVMGADQIKGMLEPRRNCAQGTLFRLEPAAGAFRLRPSTSAGCLGIVGDDTTAGAEVIEERCTGAADQRFLIRAG